MKRLRIVAISCVIVVLLVALLFSVIGSIQNDESIVEREEVKESTLLIDQSVQSSPRAKGNIQSLPQDNLVLKPIEPVTRSSLDLLEVPEDERNESLKVTANELNTLGEPLRALQILSTQYGESLNNLFQNKPFSKKEIDEYISLLTFSETYVSTLENTYYRNEIKNIRNALSQMAQSAREMQRGVETHSDALVAFTEQSLLLNQMIIQIGKDATARDVPLEKSDPGYIFIFKL